MKHQSEEPMPLWRGPTKQTRPCPVAPPLPRKTKTRSKQHRRTKKKNDATHEVSCSWAPRLPRCPQQLHSIRARHVRRGGFDAAHELREQRAALRSEGAVAQGRQRPGHGIGGCRGLGGEGFMGGPKDHQLTNLQAGLLRGPLKTSPQRHTPSLTSDGVVWPNKSNPCFNSD